MAQTPMQGEGTGLASIVVGIGGWTFVSGLGTFYPKGIYHAQVRVFASR